MKKKGLSAAKAKQILKDGYVKGKLLTEKQKKFFGSIADGATPLKKINGGWLDKYQDGGNTKSKSFYNLVLDKALKDKKGTLAQWNRLKDIIAYHESKSDPTAVQTGGGPGRGLYQFEPNSLKTAGQRAINYGKINNIEVPSYIIDISKGKLKDASKLTEEQQNELLLIDYLQKPNADLGKYFSGEQSEVDFWLKGHWGGEKAQGAEAAEKRRKSFIRDLKQYNKLYPEIENKGVIEDEQFKNGGWLDKFQDGGKVPDKEDITPERIEQGRQRVLDYYSSPGYLKLLRNSYENPEQEQLERINNVKNTKVLDVGDINAYTPETHSVRFMPNYYKDLTEHEFLHAGTKGPERISENEKFIISMNVTDPNREAAFAQGKDPYIEIPEEYQARLGIARMLMQHNNMFDYNTETFTQEHLDKIKKDMKENPKRWNIKGFQDVMKSRESDDALIEVMNTIAQNTQNTQSNYLAKYGKVIEDDRGQWAHPGKITKINSNNITMKGVNYPVLGISDTGDTQMMYPNGEYQYDGNSVTEYPMAKNGSLVALNQLTNFTNYNTPQPGGWLDKYN